MLTITKLSIAATTDLSLTVMPGECISIAGPSGCGKSQLLRAIADLDPHNGEIIWHDKQQHNIEPWIWRQQVGLLPAESSWWHDKVLDHFRTTGPKLCNELKKLDLSSQILDNNIIHLSSGEKQRLALIRLLQIRPQLLLLDEPTANLDQPNGQRVEELIMSYRLKTNCALIWVSHDEQQRQRVASRHYQFTKHKFDEI